jgi:asparagine synthase (glutamine-hydrolysing)
MMTAMCGIAGFMQLGGGNADAMRDIAQRMANALRHRGPDDDGVFVDAEAGVAFGFRRLAILDLSEAGAQPMTSASGRYVINFNGEVYNHASLRAQLGEQNWRGHSDTEVMLAAFEKWGVRGAVERFVGMFAFAIWDREERALSLVRDRAGVKPLYIARAGNTLMFASELKALRVHPSFDATIDPEALISYARYGYVAGPRSIYASAKKVEPGSIVRNGVEEIYWDPIAIAQRVSGTFRGGERDACDELDALLFDSVKLRMISDVPLGVFLSSGTDSTLVTALMQRADSSPVKTFTIGFDDPRFDEAAMARETARLLGTSHTEIYVGAKEAAEAVTLMPKIFDEPFDDSSQIPTYLVSRMARQSVTVALSGDGGDELFGGYHRYFLGAQLARRAERVPRAIANLIPGKRGESYRRVKRGGLMEVYEANVSSDALTPRAPRPAPSLPDDVESMMLLDFTRYLRDDVLVKVDRASMAVSLEAREPLLDHRVVEFAWSLPLAMKTQKRILKQLLERYVPRPMIDREKRGFGLPLGEWVSEWKNDLLASSSNTFALAKDADDATVWRVLMFEAWLREQ